jgi:uracil phosphoribosyltransferase
MPELHVIDHPLITHKMTHMRKKQTSTGQFRALMHEVSTLLAYEVTRDFPLSTMPIETPLAPMKAKVLDGKKIVIISILRAGDGILDGMLSILPSARVGHVGIYRDPKTLVAVEYYFKMPPHMNRRDAIVVDPMLATGHSAIAAVDRVKETAPRSIKFVCLLASREGIEAFHEQHPDVPIYTAAVDEKLNDKGYILPGLGDAGDRLFGTR